MFSINSRWTTILQARQIAVAVLIDHKMDEAVIAPPFATRLTLWLIPAPDRRCTRATFVGPVGRWRADVAGDRAGPCGDAHAILFALQSGSNCRPIHSV